MQNSCDVIIVGAGPAGLCLARSLADVGLSVVIIEKQPHEHIANPAEDGRDIALTHFSRKMLESLNAWEHIPQEDISVIREARVYNGDSPRHMRLASSAAGQLAFVVPNYRIRAAAYEAVKGHPRITVLYGASAQNIEPGAVETRVALSDGRVITAKLLVAADSRFSETRKKVGIPASMKDFGKTIVVCQMEHDLPHDGIASECFLHGHTLAVLPLVGNRASVILTVKPVEAQHILLQSIQELGAWVSREFQYRLGAMRLVSDRHAYPLVGVYADRFVAQRFALAGDAAVGMHPVTAHGFNFGLRAQHTLSRLVAEAKRRGEDIGGDGLLLRYQRIHRRATRPLYLATNGIVSLYTNDSGPAKLARSVLLQAADKMIPVKALLMAKLTEKDSGIAGIPSPLDVARSIFKRAA